MGFRTTILEQATRPLDQNNYALCKAELGQLGIRFQS